MREQYEFYDSELHSLSCKMRVESIELINKVIKEKSLIQIDDIVDVLNYGDFVKAKVHSICLCGSYGFNGYRFSFSYQGYILNKKGEVIKNRKPVYFSCYRVNGIEYTNPSYNRKRIVPATIESESNL